MAAAYDNKPLPAFLKEILNRVISTFVFFIRGRIPVEAGDNCIESPEALSIKAIGG